MNCNTTQKEIGGKSLLLKACSDALATSVATSDNLTITAHELKVGDFVAFKTIGMNTTINLTSFYYVKEVVNANTVKISATKSGSAIVFDDSETDMMVLLFKNIAGIRSKEISFSSEGIDITNQDSDEWMTMLDKAGIRSVSISGSGVYNAGTAFKSVRDKFLANSLVCLMFVDVIQSEIIEGCFKITEFTFSGDYDAEASFSISAESSGQINIFTV
jgi:TP901-1 family phage major tail protein